MKDLPHNYEYEDGYSEESIFAIESRAEDNSRQTPHRFVLSGLEDSHQTALFDSPENYDRIDLNKAQKSELKHLRSGMQLPATPEIRAKREALNSMLHESYRASFQFKNAQEIPDRLSMIDERMHLVQHENEAYSRCAHYVFGETLGDNWAEPGKALPVNFWLDTREILEDQGYEIVARPQQGDAVGYVYGEDDSFVHFGVLQEDGTVLSKFGLGPVINHPPELVPEEWGEKLYFFRKRF